MQYTEMDVQDKRCLITGATAGIGLETAKALAQRGAHVILVGRNAEKGARVLQDIRAASSHPSLVFLQADLSVQSQIRQLTEEVHHRYDGLDILINNAGAIFQHRELSPEGLERTFALNHLNYFMLTLLLLDLIKAEGGGRIINVASRAHVGASLDLEDLQNTRRYRAFKAYADSKLCNVLFTYHLAGLLKDTGVTVNTVHPGLVRSDFGKNNPGMYKMIKPISQLFGISAEKGAETLVYLACAQEVQGTTGKYYVNCRSVPSSKNSYDPTLQEGLWQKSLALIGMSSDAS